MIRSTRLFALLAVSVIATGCALDDEGDELEVSDEDLAADDEFDQASADSKADGELSYVAVARLARTAGLSCTGERIAIAVAVAKAESGFDPRISNTRGNTHGVDRGLWQVNSYWHPNVSDACAYSASCNARAMARISNKGTKWSPWWTYLNGKHHPFMARARAAAATACAE